MSGVFINYRRADSRDAVSAIYGRLVERFGAGQVFRDANSMLAGERYPPTLRARLRAADVVVAVVGPRWVELLEAGRGQRVDWVREELATAFELGIPVVPVLLGDAGRLDPGGLPADVRELALLQVRRVSHEFDVDMAGLVGRIEELVPELGIARLFEAGAAPLDLTRNAPSSVLRPEYGVVRMAGREAELGGLRAWARGSQSFAVKVMVGQGGSGKTRLALALRDELVELGWTAGFVAEHAPAADVAQVGRGRSPRLLVVDDAAGRVEQVAALVGAANDQRGGAPVRLLLLARTTGTWLRDLQGHRDEPVARALRPVTSSTVLTLDAATADPAGQFVAACAAFARVLGRPAPAVTTPRFDRGKSVLAMHLAALETVLGQDVLTADRRRFRAVARADGRAQLTAGNLGAVATVATLCRPASAERAAAARKLVAAVLGTGDTAAAEYLGTLRALYPGEHEVGPVLPEPVGAAIAAATLADRPDLLANLAAAGNDDQLSAALAVLGRWATTHPELGTALVELVRQDPDRLGLLGIDAAARSDEPEELVRLLGRAATASATSIDAFRTMLRRLQATTTDELGGTFAQAVAREMSAAWARRGLRRRVSEALLIQMVQDVARSDAELRTGEADQVIRMIPIMGKLTADRLKSGLAAGMRLVRRHEQGRDGS